MDNKTVVPPQKKLLPASPEKVTRRKKKEKKLEWQLQSVLRFTQTQRLSKS